MRFILLTFLALLGAHTVEAQNLPVLRIKAKKAIGPEARTECTVMLVLPGQTEPAKEREGEIKVRGASSQAYEKKSFSLKLDHPVALLDLPKNREWVLNAAFVDCSMMRHKLSYDLMRAMGTPATPRIAPASRFIEVELNGRYHGLYLLMQPVDDLLVGFPSPKDSDVTPAVIYKAVDHAANFGQPGHEGYDQRLPDPIKSPTWTPLEELNKFVSQSSDLDFRDPQTGIASRLDLDNAIDFHLLVLMTSNFDGITKNYNLARPAANKATPNPKFFFVPWDYDATFGRNWDGSRENAKAWLSNRLFDRLFADPALRLRYAQRWRELRAKTFTTEALSAQIDANAATIGDAALRNEKRWKQLDYANPRERTFANDLAQMKRWIPQRLEWLDAELAQRTGR